MSSAPMVTGLDLVVSIVLFIAGYPRGRRALTAGTPLIVLTMAVSVSPAGQSVSGWLVD